MTYARFCNVVKEAGITVAELRCEVPPTEAVLDLMEQLGLNAYERFVTRYARENA